MSSIRMLRWIIQAKRKGIQVENPSIVRKISWLPFDKRHYLSVKRCVHCPMRRRFLHRPCAECGKKDGSSGIPMRSDEALDIAEAHLRGDTGHMIGTAPNAFDTLVSSMNGMFLSEEDAAFAAENDLQPLPLNE
mmetsp:Transcript_5172/g.7285  ORF Transcript_5172/g.7285 Transcript_5172/m.7285 type:complete len:134 (-) Transcript_5172:34-435(-)